MNLPWVYTCSQSRTPLPPSGSSQCTSPKHPVSCIKPGLAIRFTYDIIHVSMPFSQIIPPSPSLTESKRLFYTSVSLLLSCIQGYHYHFSKFHIIIVCNSIYITVIMKFIILSINNPYFGEGNGTPLQYSCLANPMDRGAWWAAVHGVKELDMIERLMPKE